MLEKVTKLQKDEASEGITDNLALRQPSKILIESELIDYQGV